MLESARWLLAIEVIGFALLPLTFSIFPNLPDRGYPFAKTVGLIMITYAALVGGSLFSLGTSVWFAAAILATCAAFGLWRYRASEGARGAYFTPSIRLILIEEALFVFAFILWTILRAYLFHPEIAHTEQFMDLAMLNASYHASSYPPNDPWLSGHTVNYYYFGYLMYAVLAKFSITTPTVAYNLSLSTIFALLVTGSLSIGLALTKHLRWAVLSPIYLTISGNLRPVLNQLPHRHLPGNTHFWFWTSTRVVWRPGDVTINEFPFFSLALGDLHPHVMALPVTLLPIGASLSLIFHCPRRSQLSLWQIIMMALIVGSLGTINSWDYPTYLLLIGIFIFISYVRGKTAKGLPIRAVVEIVILSILSYVLYLPFYLRFASPAQGIGFVYTRSALFPFIEVFGMFLVAVGVLGIAWHRSAWRGGGRSPGFGLSGFRLRERARSEPAYLATVAGLAIGGGVLAVLVLCTAALLLLVMWVYHLLVLALILALSAGIIIAVRCAPSSARLRTHDIAAAVFILFAFLLLVITELVYLRDTFAGTPSYRMNTVFKLYYQVWTILSLTCAYAVYRSATIFRRLRPSKLWKTAGLVLATATACSLAYPVLAPASMSASFSDPGDIGVDGMNWMRLRDPTDYFAVRWLEANAPVSAVELERPTVAYDHLSRISAYTGMSTVLGWMDHEHQWRPKDRTLTTRWNDIVTTYETLNPMVAASLLRSYHVQYVVVGPPERQAYLRDPESYRKFLSFMRVVYQARGTQILTWRRPGQTASLRSVPRPRPRGAVEPLHVKGDRKSFFRVMRTEGQIL